MSVLFPSYFAGGIFCEYGRSHVLQPIVATDFPFNTEVLLDACLYYESKNAKDASANLAKMISDKDLQSTMRERMKHQLAIYGDYDAHFNAIKEYLIQVAMKEI